MSYNREDSAVESGPAVKEPGLLSAALNPRSIAVVGASDNSNKIGGRPLLYLARFGYKGRVYPINPHRAEVQGLRAYPDIFSLPETPDLTIVAVPSPSVGAAVADCAARGVGAAIVMASGYGETADTSAIAAQDAMVQRARAAGMRLIGPNSQGLANFGTGAVASFSTMFLQVEPLDGPVGIISQSGMMSTAPYGLLRSRGIGVRHAHATGNDADVTLPELALAVVQDPEVRLLLLYIESIKDPDRLAEVAAIARERDVPIVAVKTGRTARGQAAARSHTGALANEDRVVDAFFKRHGIWRARDVHELVAGAELYLKGWRPKAGRLVVVSNSGASCVMAADAVQDNHLDLATLSDRTVSALSAQLPSFATATNPIDVTAALLTDSQLLGRILGILSDDPAFDLLLLAIPVAGTGYDVPAFAKAASDFAARTAKPAIVAAPQESVAARFHDAGVPTFANQSEAMAVLAQLVHHVRIMRRPATPTFSLPAPSFPAGGSTFLDEAESFDFLSGQGMPMVSHRLCRTEGEAKEAYRHFGGAVALKACSSAFPHKSDHGLVILDVHDEVEVAAAFASLQERLRALGYDGGVLVAPMITSRRELVLGAKVDRTFGPVLMIGDGGRYVEALGDIALLIAPASVEDVREALIGLRVAPLLQRVRGEPPLDVEAFCAAAVRLSHIIVAFSDRIASIDLNPVMIGRQGEGVVIVDALVERNCQEVLQP